MFVKDIGPAIFPGSFDPLTNGHVDVIERSLALFDRLVVAVLDNSAKASLFTVDERAEMITQTFSAWGERVQVICFSGLLVDFVKKTNARVVIRGLRAVSDFEYEAQMALMNRNLCEDIETFFLMTRENYSYVSSSAVKTIAQLGGDVSKLVPAHIASALKDKIGGQSWRER